MRQYEYFALLRNKSGFQFIGVVTAYSLDDALPAAQREFPLFEVIAVAPHISQVGGAVASLYGVESMPRVGNGFKG